MGHYYSEMCCETCGNLPCRCPRKSRPDQWVLLPDGEIVKDPGGFQDRIYTWSLPHFDTLKKAQDALPTYLEKTIQSLSVETLRLSRRIEKLKDLHDKVAPL